MSELTDWLRALLRADLTSMRGDDCEHDIDCPKRRGELRREPEPIPCDCHIVEGIARADAELAILDEHYGVQAILEGIAQQACRRCSDRIPDDMRLPGGDLWHAVEPSPCKTIRLLASGYRHRPGYKAEEWAL